MNEPVPASTRRVYTRMRDFTEPDTVAYHLSVAYPDGSVVGEFSIKQVHLDPNMASWKLSIFDDAWKMAVTSFSDVLYAMATLSSKKRTITEQDLEAMFEACGLVRRDCW